MANQIKKHCNKRCIIIFLVSAIVTAIILTVFLYKPPIENAEINDLMRINGIGAIKAGQVQKYFDIYQNANIEDVEILDGIGKETVEKLKKEYR